MPEVITVEDIVSPDKDYVALNAEVEVDFQNGGSNWRDHDKQAAREYFLQHVNKNTVFFGSLAEKLDYLVENDYYESEVIEKYDFEFVKRLFKRVYSEKFRFQSYLGAYKYYTSYTLKTFDGKRYLERFEDRVAIVSLYLGEGDEEKASNIANEIITGRFQPATPTFLNAGKKQRGELVSCFLIRVEDNMESISRSINGALQLSKRGGGVAIDLTNLRESGAPIKKIENQSSGVVPVMKLLEDSFGYADQLGARKGAGAVYLNVHHPDIYKFLDTKRENADEKVRIKNLSVGVVIPDVTMELLKKGSNTMYLFSPYDVERVYGVPMSDLNITEHYDEMVSNPKIRKKKINPKELMQTIADLQFQSGYPYIMWVDTANRMSPIKGTITMSNLCSEIVQVSKPSYYNEDLSYSKVGKDISCNLGSLNIARTFDSPDFGKTIETAIRALTTVSELSNVKSVPSIERGNKMSHAIGLGQMNLHGFLGREHIHYDSKEAVDFTNIYFYSVLYQCLKASHKLAVERGSTFEGFEDSDYASGAFFDKYIEKDWSVPRTDKVKELLGKTSMYVPKPEDWVELREAVMRDGIYNQNLQAVPPTGSISYINNSTSSIHPIVRPIEIRKEGKTGRVYYPAPHMDNENMEYFETAYDIGPKAIIRIYAAAQQHVDQGLSCTLFYGPKATTKDMIKAWAYAWGKGLKTLYYARVTNTTLKGTEVTGLQRKKKSTSTPAPDVSVVSVQKNGLKEKTDTAPMGLMLDTLDDGGDECESCML